jgi:ribose 5-phosphate isomerase
MKAKKVKLLGENNHPVPMEVLPFAAPVLMQKIKEQGGKTNFKRRYRKGWSNHNGQR